MLTRHEVKYHISQLPFHSRAFFLFSSSSLFAFPLLPFHAFLFFSIRCRRRYRLLLQSYILSWATASVAWRTDAVLCADNLSLTHRIITQRAKADYHSNTHTHTPLPACPFCPVWVYCLGKWVCAPSGGISLNKNLDVWGHRSSPGLPVWPLPLGTDSPSQLRLTPETRLLNLESRWAAAVGGKERKTYNCWKIVRKYKFSVQAWQAVLSSILFMASYFYINSMSLMWIIVFFLTLCPIRS